jgi:hypothetical protein
MAYDKAKVYKQALDPTIEIKKNGVIVKNETAN